MHRAFCLLLVATTALAAEPEITRPPATPQAVGTPHTLRNVPEACVRIEGVFEGAGYTASLKAKPGCQPRAGFAADIGTSAPVGDGWLLNDVLRVPRIDRPDCIASVSVWRHPGALAPIEADGQRRVRLYLDEKQKASDRPRFAASLSTTEACRS